MYPLCSCCLFRLRFVEDSHLEFLRIEYVPTKLLRSHFSPVSLTVACIVICYGLRIQMRGASMHEYKCAYNALAVCLININVNKFNVAF